MAVIILSWGYMVLICALIGVGMLGLFREKRFSMTIYVVAGIIGITVYAQFFSIFAKIGMWAHVVLVVMALVSGYCNRSMVWQLWQSCKLILFSWEGFFYICFVLLIAFFTSRGEFHTDTNIYHAAAIRIYEEYGLVKGIGNLQLHYAYNSSYLAFASVFSLKWLLGSSLHATTGFLETVMCLYAFHGLRAFRQHADHVTDMMRVGILIYTLVNVTRSMSPATDYATMFLALFIVTAWCENFFEKGSDFTVYCLLTVAAVFAATLKFSCSLLILIGLYPVCRLVRERKWKEIGIFLSCGCVVLCPFLVRNYLIF